MKIRFIILFFISTLTLFSQEIYQIDDFGTYIISNNKIHKVSHNYMEKEGLNFVCFRGNYAVFENMIGSQLVIYDIENDITSDEMNNSRYLSSDFIFGIQDNENEVLVYAWGNLYILERTTLTIKDIYLDVDKYDFVDINNFERDALEYELTNRNTNRLILNKDNRYIDIIYTQDFWDKQSSSSFHELFSFDNNINYIDGCGERVVIHVWYYPYAISR